MKSTKLRITALLLALLMMATVFLTACDQTDRDDDDDDRDDREEEEEENNASDDETDVGSVEDGDIYDLLMNAWNKTKKADSLAFSNMAVIDCGGEYNYHSTVKSSGIFYYEDGELVGGVETSEKEGGNTYKSEDFYLGDTHYYKDTHGDVDSDTASKDYTIESACLQVYMLEKIMPEGLTFRDIAEGIANVGKIEASRDSAEIVETNKGDTLITVTGTYLKIAEVLMGDYYEEWVEDYEENISEMTSSSGRIEVAVTSDGYLSGFGFTVEYTTETATESNSFVIRFEDYNEEFYLETPSWVGGSTDNQQKKMPEIEMGDSQIEIEIGETFDLYWNMDVYHADDVTFKSSSKKYVTVDEYGEICGVAAGTATITVTATNENGSVHDTFTVTVVEATFELPTFMPFELKATLDAGETYDLYNSSYTTAALRELYFESGNENVATVSASGTIKAIGKGKTTVYVYYVYDDEQYLLAEFEVIVEKDAFEPPYYNSFIKKLVLYKGETCDLYENALTAATIDQLYYESENTAVATVTNGVVKGVKIGSTTINVYYVYDGDLYWLEAINISVEKPDWYFFPYESFINIDVGNTYNLLNNSITDAPFSAITYAISDTSIARISADGIITGLKEGNVSLMVYGAGEKLATLSVTIRAPWAPTDPDTIAVLEARDTLTKFDYMGWYNVSIDYVPNYNPENLTGTTAGPVEIWADHLQILFKLDKSECDATAGIDNPETYEYRFMLYYRPYDYDNDRGDYEVAELKCWSIGYTDQPIYRCHFYDTLYKGMEEDVEYEVVLVVYKGDEALGFAEQFFVWTDSCEAFVRVAENDTKIVK